jgi:hypothetical protein
MIFHPSRGKSSVLHKYIEQSVVALALLPACHREDVWLLALLHAPVRSAHQIERRERGVAMNISGSSCTCLTVQQPGELLAVTEEKLDLEMRGIEFHQFMTMQLRISRAQHNDPRLGRVLPVEEHHQAQATLQRFVPHPGSIQRQRRFICYGSEVLETVQGLEVDFPVILPPCPASLRVRTGVEKEAVGVAPQLGDRMQIEAADFITIFLLRIVAIYTMLGEARRQALSMRTQRLFVAVDPRVFRLSLRGFLPRRRLRDGERQSAPTCNLDHGERGYLQPAFGAARTAVEEVPAPARLFATLWDEGRVMRRDQCRARVERRPQHALRKVWPVKRLPKLPCDRACRVVAVATQVAAVDATTPHKDRDQHRSKELPLGLTEPGQLFQEIVDHCHKPCTG